MERHPRSGGGREVISQKGTKMEKVREGLKVCPFASFQDHREIFRSIIFPNLKVVTNGHTLRKRDILFTNINDIKEKVTDSMDIKPLYNQKIHGKVPFYINTFFYCENCPKSSKSIWLCT